MVTAWDVAHTVLDAVAYLFATRWLTEWALKKWIAHVERLRAIADAAARLGGRRPETRGEFLERAKALANRRLP